MQSLIDLCCKVLAENLQAIDGLDFVPEHLGRKISKFVSQSLLNSPLVSLDAYIRLFFQAYGGLFISGFRLQPCPTFSTWVKALSHCNSLTVLCLDSCNLELEHSDVLPYIGRVQSLKFLSLRWNTLTNDSVRSLTAYWRFCGGCKLSIVDISGNPFLGETVVRLLTQLSSLQVVYLSDTGVAVSKSALPLGWGKRTNKKRLVPKFPRPSGWLWEDFGTNLFSSPEDFSEGLYESPLVIFRLRI